MLSEVIDVVARSADGTSGLESIYTVALSGLQRALGVERASILLFDPDGVMRFKAWQGISDSYRKAVEGHTPWSQDAIDPPPFIVPDVHSDPELTRLLPVFARENIRALVFIPLVYGGRLLGKFMLYSRVPYQFKREAEFALTLGRCIAFAIVRKKKEDELTAANRQKEVLIQREKEATREAEKSVQLRDDFLSVASHEFQTPLTALKMQLQVIPRVLQKVSFSGKDEFFGLFKNSLKQLDQFSRLVDELLDVSRISAGRLVLTKESVALSELINRVVGQYQGDLEAAGCVVNIQVDQAIRGHWDPIRIEQVVVNLLTNAMKYGAGHPIEISAHVEDRWVKLTLKDQGIGIAKENQKRIFDRFERVVPVTGYRGLGLGLYITRQIVEAHGGHIHVESELGKGATFSVELPLLDGSDYSQKTRTF